VVRLVVVQKRFNKAVDATVIASKPIIKVVNKKMEKEKKPPIFSVVTTYNAGKELMLLLIFEPSACLCDHIKPKSIAVLGRLCVYPINR